MLAVVAAPISSENGPQLAHDIVESRQKLPQVATGVDLTGMAHQAIELALDTGKNGLEFPWVTARADGTPQTPSHVVEAAAFLKKSTLSGAEAVAMGVLLKLAGDP